MRQIIFVQISYTNEHSVRDLLSLSVYSAGNTMMDFMFLWKNLVYLVAIKLNQTIKVGNNATGRFE